MDIWALGILLFQLTAKKHPFERPTDLELLQAIKDSEPADLPDTVPDLIRYLIEILLNKDPDSRFDTTMILNIPRVNEHVQRLGNQVKAFDPEMAEKFLANQSKLNE